MLVARELPLDIGRHAKRVARGTDRLVCLLRVLDLAFVASRRRGHELLAVQLFRLRPRSRQRRLRQRRGVGAHVRDVAALVEPLGDTHRRLRREAQLPARLLLQRRGHERSGRAAPVGLLLDRADGERRAIECGCERPGRLLFEREDVALQSSVVPEVSPLCDTRSCHRNELGLERARIERADDVPVRRRDELHPLALALDDEPRRDGLDATRGEARGDLHPEDGRHFVAVEPVEDPSRLLRVHQVGIDLTRLAEGALDRILRDLVEDHSPDRNLRAQDLEQMPRDCLSLAVFVRREEKLGGVLQLALELVDLLLLVGVDDVEGLERVVDVDAEAGPRFLLHRSRNIGGAVGEVADMTDRGLHDIAVAEIAGNGLCLRGRLDDHETTFGHGCPFRVG